MVGVVTVLLFCLLLLCPAVEAMAIEQSATPIYASEWQVSEEQFADWRQQMVQEQIRARGIQDERVLNALSTIPRHRFVDPFLAPLAYGDYPLSIGYQQTISQPYMVAYMTAAAEIPSGATVLEIGTGSGYQAAVLGKLSQTVYSVERIPELAEQARRTLHQLGYTNIVVKSGDGYQGWADHAPYDAIVVTAAPPEVPPALIQQLAVQGKLIIPVGQSQQDLLVITKTSQGVLTEKKIPVRFVPLVHDP